MLILTNPNLLITNTITNHTIPYHTIPYHTILYHTINHTKQYQITPCLTSPYHTQYIISYQSNQNKYCNKVGSYKCKQVRLHNFDGNTLFFIWPKVRVFFDRRPMVFQSFLFVMGQRTITRMVVKNNEIFIFPRTITLPQYTAFTRIYSLCFKLCKCSFLSQPVIQYT